MVVERASPCCQKTVYTQNRQERERRLTGVVSVLMGGWHCLSFSLFFPPKRYGEVEMKKKKKQEKLNS